MDYMFSYKGTGAAMARETEQEKTAAEQAVITNEQGDGLKTGASEPAPALTDLDLENDPVWRTVPAPSFEEAIAKFNASSDKIFARALNEYRETLEP